MEVVAVHGSHGVTDDDDPQIPVECQIGSIDSTSACTGGRPGGEHPDIAVIRPFLNLVTYRIVVVYWQVGAFEIVRQGGGHDGS